MGAFRSRQTLSAPPIPSAACTPALAALRAAISAPSAWLERFAARLEAVWPGNRAARMRRLAGAFATAAIAHHVERDPRRKRELFGEMDRLRHALAAMLDPADADQRLLAHLMARLAVADRPGTARFDAAAAPRLIAETMRLANRVLMRDGNGAAPLTAPAPECPAPPAPWRASRTSGRSARR